MLLDEAGRYKLMRKAVAAELELRGEREYLSVRRAAEVVEVCEDTVRGWIALGRLGRYKAGRELRVRRDELDRLLEDMGRRAPLAAAAEPEPTVEETQREQVARLLRGER
jgi:excisionase family DNA binding protein